MIPTQTDGGAGRKGAIEAGQGADLARLHPDSSVAATMQASEVDCGTEEAAPALQPVTAEDSTARSAPSR